MGKEREKGKGQRQGKARQDAEREPARGCRTRTRHCTSSIPIQRSHLWTVRGRRGLQQARATHNETISPRASSCVIAGTLSDTSHERLTFEDVALHDGQLVAASAEADGGEA